MSPTFIFIFRPRANPSYILHLLHNIKKTLSRLCFQFGVSFLQELHKTLFQGSVSIWRIYSTSIPQARRLLSGSVSYFGVSILHSKHLLLHNQEDSKVSVYFKSVFLTLSFSSFLQVIKKCRSSHASCHSRICISFQCILDSLYVLEPI